MAEQSSDEKQLTNSKKATKVHVHCMQHFDELSSLNIVSTVSLVISSRVWSFYVNLKVSLYKPQGLGISEVGRSPCGI